MCGLPVVELVTEVAGVGGPPLDMLLQHVVLHDGVRAAGVGAALRLAGQHRLLGRTVHPGMRLPEA